MFLLAPTRCRWQYWLELALFAWYFYFNFSGFSDMAIGCARLLGFKLAPNFNNPYMKTNPQDFWNSWHMSLTRFAQRNVFVPMGGMRARTQYPAIVATMMVIALWHGLSIPLVSSGSTTRRDWSVTVSGSRDTRCRRRARCCAGSVRTWCS